MNHLFLALFFLKNKRQRIFSWLFPIFDRYMIIGWFYVYKGQGWKFTTLSTLTCGVNIKIERKTNIGTQSFYPQPPPCIHTYMSMKIHTQIHMCAHIDTFSSDISWLELKEIVKMTQRKGFYQLLYMPPTPPPKWQNCLKMIKYNLGQMSCKMAGTGIFSMETTGQRAPAFQGWKAVEFSEKAQLWLLSSSNLKPSNAGGGAICRGARF